MSNPESIPGLLRSASNDELRGKKVENAVNYFWRNGMSVLAIKFDEDISVQSLIRGTT